MPEGPELHISALTINKICANNIFNGEIKKNPIHTKCEEIVWDGSEYTMEAESRGKELMLHLTSIPQTSGKNKEEKQKKTSILVTFGMSGKFEFTHADETEKHSHLIFFTKGSPKMALSFVDYRRFGKWFQGKPWNKERGPCILQESSSFIQNVAENLDNCAFNKPICEVLLNQKFFSGIGNYLRAEILYRCEIPPFEQAREILKLKECYANIKQEMSPVKKESKYFKDEPIKGQKKAKKRKQGNEPSQEVVPVKTIKVEQEDVKPVIKTEMKYAPPDADFINRFEDKSQELLRLCHSVPLEVVQLGSKKASLSEMYYDDSDGSFNNWLQCYAQPDMKNLVDHNKRTIWFTGKPGPMAPKDQKSRGPKVSKKKNGSNKQNTEMDHDYGTKKKVNLVGPRKKQVKEKEPKKVNGSSGKETKPDSDSPPAKTKSKTRRKSATKEKKAKAVVSKGVKVVKENSRVTRRSLKTKHNEAYEK